MADKPVRVHKHERSQYVRRAPGNERMRTQAYKEVDRAYADTAPGADWKRSSKIRNLDFKGNWTEDKELAKLEARRIGSYNDFDPETVSEMINGLPDGTNFRFAREGSPALYLRKPGTSPTTLFALAGRFQFAGADEYDWDENEVRLWWD